jgi:hypothetical protein
LSGILTLIVAGHVTPLTDELVAQMLPLELAQVIVENSVFTPDVSPRPKPK